jgi:prepilin-type N-terminal cleavage/methylation domain-containing protein
MRRSDRGSGGMTLPELLLAVVVVGLMVAVGVGGGSRSLARQRVEAAARQLAVGLEQARSSAEASGRPCALALATNGWGDPGAAEAGSQLPSCQLSEATLRQGVQLRHNLPGELRISSTGLVLDGGTIVLAAAGTDLQRCLVVSLPLGVVRFGQSKAGSAAAPRSADCVVDPLL